MSRVSKFRFCIIKRPYSSPSVCHSLPQNLLNFVRRQFPIVLKMSETFANTRRFFAPHVPQLHR